MNRLKEASTWAGLGAFAQMLATVFPQYAIPLHGITVMAVTLAGVIPDAAAKQAAA